MLFRNGITMAAILLIMNILLVSSLLAPLSSSVASNSCTSLSSAFLEYLRIPSNMMWYVIIAEIFIICHTNQISINFKYDVLGRSLLIAFSRVAMTRRAVPAPINLSLGCSIPIKRVEYPNNHKRNVGRNVVRS